jgi:hypothetical protein
VPFLPCIDVLLTRQYALLAIQTASLILAYVD